MKRLTAFIAAAIVTLVASLAFAAMDHGHGDMKMEHDGKKMEHGDMKMEHGGMMAMGKLAHEEVVDGVKATFKVMDIKEKMAKMGMKETHHIMVVFTNAKTGKMMSKGEVKIKVQGPDKSEQMKDLMGMEGGFGTDFSLPKAGKYGVMSKFKLDDGKVRTVKFWYTVK